MRNKFFPLLLILLATTSFGQRKSNWQRVYAFDESVIEMNTRTVVVTSDGVGRATFRWTFDHPESYSPDHRLKYKTRIEVIEFNCDEKLFRTYDQTLLDEGNRVVRYDAMYWLDDWRSINTSVVTSTLAEPACMIIKPPRMDPESTSHKEAEALAVAFYFNLDRTKNFRTAATKYFLPGYVERYRRDPKQVWFQNLDRQVLEKASHAELQNFNNALMNATYWSSHYVNGLYEPPAVTLKEEQLVTPELLKLIKYHPYTKIYGRGQKNFDYLAEKIDTVSRLKSYTNLLEQIGRYFQRHARHIDRPRTEEGEEDVLNNELHTSGCFVCTSECLGLPKGTKIWEIDIPVFRLQITEVKGRMRIISARPNF